MKILMLITGGIAAHKAPSISSALSTYCDHEVHIMATQNALKFFTKDAIMYSATKWWNDEYMAHIKVIDDVQIDKLIVVPATANIIGKIANGIGDDEVSTTCIKCPTSVTKILFPAMNPDMWNNSIVQDNIEKLLIHGWCVVDPGYGKMACGAVGQGVLPETRYLTDCVRDIEHQREITINQFKKLYNIVVWYRKYVNQIFRLGMYETNEYYSIDPRVDDPRLNHGNGSSYHVNKKDGKITYLTHLNRIKDYKFDLRKGYVSYES